MSKTYIYRGKEYKTTGRTAEKTTRNVVKTLHEIKPSGSESTESVDFNVWVDMNELYEVKENEQKP